MKITYQEAVRWIIFKKNIDKYRKKYPSPILAYQAVEKVEKMETKIEMIYNSTSYKVGNKIVQFLKLFGIKKCQK